MKIEWFLNECAVILSVSLPISNEIAYDVYMTSYVVTSLPDQYQKICAALSAGKRPVDIARDAGMEVATVRYHIRKIRRLLGAKSKQEFMDWVRTPTGRRGAVMVMCCDGERREVWSKELWDTAWDNIHLLPVSAYKAILVRMQETATPDICDAIVEAAEPIRLARSKV